RWHFREPGSTVYQSHAGADGRDCQQLLQPAGQSSKPSELLLDGSGHQFRNTCRWVTGPLSPEHTCAPDGASAQRGHSVARLRGIYLWNDLPVMAGGCQGFEWRAALPAAPSTADLL